MALLGAPAQAGVISGGQGSLASTSTCRQDQIKVQASQLPGTTSWAFARWGGRGGHVHDGRVKGYIRSSVGGNNMKELTRNQFAGDMGKDIECATRLHLKNMAGEYEKGPVHRAEMRQARVRARCALVP